MKNPIPKPMPCLTVVACCLALAGCGYAGSNPDAAPTQEPRALGSSGQQHPDSAPLEAFSVESETGGDLYGYRRPDGTQVIEPKYLMALDFLDSGIGAVADSSGWSYINRDGDVLVLEPYIVDNAPEAFSEGYARYWSNDAIGFFDKFGRVKIEASQYLARPFKQGYAAFCTGCSIVRDGEYTRWSGGQWGFIDKSGAIALPADYDRVTDFVDGVAIVRKDRLESALSLSDMEIDNSEPTEKSP